MVLGVVLAAVSLAGAGVTFNVHDLEGRRHTSGALRASRAAVFAFISPECPISNGYLPELTRIYHDYVPRDCSYKVTDHFTVPVDVETIGIIPHAHYVCTDMKGWAILPDGSGRWLLWIPNWNFIWQEQYRYATPVLLPAGTRVEMEYTCDNSENNPRNPNHPPKRVRWGPGTTDKMAGLHVQIAAGRSGDLEKLGQALWGKFMRAVGGGFYRSNGRQLGMRQFGGVVISQMVANRAILDKSKNCRQICDGLCLHVFRSDRQQTSLIPANLANARGGA